MADMGMPMPPPGPADPSSAPTPDAGLAAESQAQVRQAVSMLQMALPGLPIGSEPQKKVLEAIKSLSAVVPASAEIPGVAMTQLAGLQQQAQQSATLQQLASAMGQGPNIPPVTPQ